jgi:curved DNA-binding protein CbpA
MTLNRKLLDTLLNLHNGSISGVLRIERQAEKKQLVLNKGLLVFAESNLPDEHLARIMVKLNLMSRTKVGEIVALMKDGKSSEEAVLALPDSGMQDLEKGRREQATVILASLLSWDNCSLHFYPGDSLVRYQLNLGLSLPEALAISVRRAVSGRLIPMPPTFPHGTCCRTEDPSTIAMNFPLNNAESYAYSLLQEPMRAEDMLALIPDTGTRPEEILLRLLVLGLVTLQDTSPQKNAISKDTKSNSELQKLEDMLAAFESAGLYEVLEISPEASPDEVQIAYHRMAKQFHPDRFQSKEFSDETRSTAEQVFTQINRAYLTLKDPVFRADYDEKRLSKESRVEAELKARGGGHAEDDRTAEAIFRDGRVLLSKGEFEKAVEHLKACLWLSPEKATYNHFLGVAESEIPKLRKSAEQHLLKALELDRTSISSRLELAKLYIKVMLRRKAEYQLQEILRWDPENREVPRLFDELKNIEQAKKS